MEKCEIGQIGEISIIRLTKSKLREVIAQCKYQSFGFTDKAPYFAPTHGTFLNIYVEKCRNEDNRDARTS